MFKWMKNEGCNCCPIPEGSEHYSLYVGRLYRGEVKFNGKVWSAKVFVTDSEHCATGVSGGTMNRDEAMKIVEDDIYKSISSLMSVFNDQTRKICEALTTFDEQGNAIQKELQ